MKVHFSARASWQVLAKRLFSITGIVVAAVGLIGAAPAGAAPAISAIAAGQITATSAVVTWKTDVAGDSYVSYVASTGADAQFVSDANLVTNHTVTLTGLQAGTTYSFTVNSADSQGDNAAANGTDFTTLSSGGTVSPNPPAPVPPAPTPTPAPAPAPSPAGLSVPSGLSYAELQSVYGPKFTQPIYPTGTLAKENGTIYFIMGKDGVKVPFTSMAAFTGLGYKTKNVQTLDLSAFRLPSTGYTISSASQQHPWGQVLEYKGTLYYSHVSGMVPIPSMDVFNANGFKSAWVVPMNAADIEVLNNYPVMYPLEANDDRVQ